MPPEPIPSSAVERIARLEVQLEHAMATLDAMAHKVDDLHELLLQAKGARWAIVGVAGLAGFLSGKASSLLAVFLAPK